jgi:hypothetical protein
MRERKGPTRVRYTDEIRAGVIGAASLGMTQHEIVQHLGISKESIRSWIEKDGIRSKRISIKKRNRKRLPQVKELQIIPDKEAHGSEFVRVHLPNHILLEVPVHSMSLDFLKGLMGIGALCS